MSKELGRDLTGMDLTGMGMAGMDLSAELADRIAAWLEAPYDGETIAAVKDLIEQGNIAELTDSFYKDLEFGTGGLRGILGVGTNRMNNYTVGKATQGLSNYLRKIYPDEQVKVAISYDSRNQSPEFSRLIASILLPMDLRSIFLKDCDQRLSCLLLYANWVATVRLWLPLHIIPRNIMAIKPTGRMEGN